MIQDRQALMDVLYVLRHRTERLGGRSIPFFVYELKKKAFLGKKKKYVGVWKYKEVQQPEDAFFYERERKRFFEQWGDTERSQRMLQYMANEQLSYFTRSVELSFENKWGKRVFSLTEGERARKVLSVTVNGSKQCVEQECDGKWAGSFLLDDCTLFLLDGLESFLDRLVLEDELLYLEHYLVPGYRKLLEETKRGVRKRK